jgi:anthranilate synthase/aminodeoxychorismate synthase-like glutamine amidotransferase
MKHILLLDNYDSFTWNLVHYLLEAGVDCRVMQNDDLRVLDYPCDAALLSPGPKEPRQAGLLMAFIEARYRHLPMLGVCLGHQALGLHFGARLDKAAEPVHGKTTMISHDGLGVYRGLPDKFRVCRYHSLLLREAGPDIQVSAKAPDGAIMGIRHRQLPLEGVQFHPEAILTEYGREMLHNWLESLNQQ